MGAKLLKLTFWSQNLRTEFEDSLVETEISRIFFPDKHVRAKISGPNFAERISWQSSYWIWVFIHWQRALSRYHFTFSALSCVDDVADDPERLLWHLKERFQKLVAGYKDGAADWSKISFADNIWSGLPSTQCRGALWAVLPNHLHFAQVMYCT